MPFILNSSPYSKVLILILSPTLSLRSIAVSLVEMYSSQPNVK